MERLYQMANQYTIDLRAVSQEDGQVKIYTDKQIYPVEREMSFDIENDQLTSLDHFVGGIASAILLSLIKADRRKGFIEEMEGKFSFQLSNPLYYCDVQGYDQPTTLTEVNLRLYLISFEKEEDLAKLIKEALSHCILYQTLKNTINFHIDWKVTF